MLETLLQNIANGGLTASILAVMLWFNYTMVKKVIEMVDMVVKALTTANNTQTSSNKVIEDNTKVLSGVKQIMQVCHTDGGING